MSKHTDACAPADALQTLSSHYAQNNARIRSGVERQIDRLLPSASTGDTVSKRERARARASTAKC